MDNFKENKMSSSTFSRYAHITCIHAPELVQFYVTMPKIKAQCRHLN